MRDPAGETVRCCGEAWVDAYARRARRVMSAYARGGAASVVWLRLPAPRNRGVATVWLAVNEALERAAAGLPTVQTLPLDEVLSPGWRYRASSRYRGRQVRVRLSDGAHVSLPGARIAAREVIRALRQASGIRSDSEVVVHGYEEHGTDVVRHLNGIFAFALSTSGLSACNQRLVGGQRAQSGPLLHYHRADAAV